MRIGDVISMVTLGIVLVCAVLIVGNFQNAIGNLNLTGTANSTANTVFSNLWSGLLIGSIGIIVAAAVGIIVLILSSVGTIGYATGGTGE